MNRFLARCMLLLSALLFVPCVQAQDAGSLRARHGALREQLAQNPFQRPLVLESSESDGALRGDIHAVIEQPFGVVAPALREIDHWCEILMLHLNVKDCHARAGGRSALSLAVVRTFDQPLSEAFRLEFDYGVPADSRDYLQVRLNADVGPLGTKDYRILIETVPLDATSSFVHMSYSYAYGTAAQIAMRAYLATFGRNKVGFTVTGQEADGRPIFMGNARGVVERNTMRYYLAIEAYLGAYALPPAQQAEKRLRDWFAAIERYPRQLHDMERDEYLSMKRKELIQQPATTARKLS